MALIKARKFSFYCNWLHLQKNCTISVNTVPLWNITLDGDPREVDEAQEKLAEIIEGVHYREVYLSNSIICDGSEGSRSKLNRFKNAMMSLDVPKRVVDNAEVIFCEVFLSLD